MLRAAFGAGIARPWLRAAQSNRHLAEDRKDGMAEEMCD